MLVTGFAAGPWATNCWLVADQPGAECLVIDPGYDSAQGVADLAAKYSLKPVAVLLSHGHMDHMWSVTPIANGYGIPAMIAKEDLQLLSRPELAVSEQGKQMIRELGGDFVEPDQVQVLQDDEILEIAGLRLRVSHTPGHTPGSMVYRFENEGTIFSGDLLFKGSIGRTDLPGGDSQQMQLSLAKLFAETADDVVVHPGHGSSTSIGEERRTNPYVQSLRGFSK